MKERIPPKKMAARIAKILKAQKLDVNFVKKVFQLIREELRLRTRARRARKLPELLTEAELSAFYDAVWNAEDATHMVMIKLLIYTGIRNAELANLSLRDVDLKSLRIRINHGKGRRDRYVPIPAFFRGELHQYMKQLPPKAVYLFETNRKRPYTTRWIREIVKRYARIAGVEKRIYPHLFRHQLLTYLTSKGIVDAKIQLVSGHQSRHSLALYQELSLIDVEAEYQKAMKDFPIQ